MENLELSPGFVDNTLTGGAMSSVAAAPNLAEAKKLATNRGRPLGRGGPAARAVSSNISAPSSRASSKRSEQQPTTRKRNSKGQQKGGEDTGEPAEAQGKGGTSGGYIQGTGRDDLADKALLMCMQKLRMIEHVLMKKWLAPQSCPSVQELFARGDSYYKSTLGQSGHGLGGPMVHYWAGQWKYLANLETLPQDLLTEARKYATTIGEYQTQPPATPLSLEEAKTKTITIMTHLRKNVKQFHVQDIGNSKTRITINVTEQLGPQMTILDKCYASLMYEELLDQQSPYAMEKALQARLRK
jgi:hypothetical protein